MTSSYQFNRVTYATPDDLPGNLGVLPDVQARIGAASDIVTWLIRNARYDVDATGKPTDPNLLDLLKEATVTQVIFADDKYGGNADDTDRAVPVALGSLRVEQPDTSGRNPNWGTRVWQNISPATWYMLRNAGLVRGQVRTTP